MLGRGEQRAKMFVIKRTDQGEVEMEILIIWVLCHVILSRNGNLIRSIVLVSIATRRLTSTTETSRKLTTVTRVVQKS